MLSIQPKRPFIVISSQIKIVSFDIMTLALFSLLSCWHLFQMFAGLTYSSTLQQRHRQDVQIKNHLETGQMNVTAILKGKDINFSKAPCI